MLTLLALGIIILLYRMSSFRPTSVTPIIQSGGELGTSAYYIVFGIIITIIIIYKFYLVK